MRVPADSPVPSLEPATPSEPAPAERSDVTPALTRRDPSPS